MGRGRDKGHWAAPLEPLDKGDVNAREGIKGALQLTGDYHKVLKSHIPDSGQYSVPSSSFMLWEELTARVSKTQEPLPVEDNPIARRGSRTRPSTK